MILCEAAGYDTIFIETVGVGQSETAVHSMVDLFLMLQISGAGDELQGIKRGIMEMADMVAITKADGENKNRAELARAHFRSALALFPMPKSGFKPQVFTCSSLDGTGLMDVWGAIVEYIQFTGENGYFDTNRQRQAKYWMYETINEALREGFYNSEAVKSAIGDLEEKVLNNRVSSFIAARNLLDIYFENR